MKIQHVSKFFIFLLSGTISFSVYSQIDYIKNRCEQSGYEIATIYQVGDLEKLIKPSDWVIKNCKNYLRPDFYYSFYNDRALGKKATLDLKGALSDVNYCISEKYDIVSCHVTKARVLLELGKKDEYKIEKEISLKMIDIKNREADDRYNPTSRDSIIYLNNSLKDLLNSMP